MAVAALQTAAFHTPCLLEPPTAPLTQLLALVQVMIFMHDINRPLEQRIAVELLTSDPHIYYQGKIKGPMVRQRLVALLGRAGWHALCRCHRHYPYSRGPKLWRCAHAVEVP